MICRIKNWAQIEKPLLFGSFRLSNFSVLMAFWNPWDSKIISNGTIDNICFKIKSWNVGMRFKIIIFLQFETSCVWQKVHYRLSIKLPDQRSKNVCLIFENKKASKRYFQQALISRFSVPHIHTMSFVETTTFKKSFSDRKFFLAYCRLKSFWCFIFFTSRKKS